MVEKAVATRATLLHYLEGLQKHIDEQRAAAASTAWEEPALGVFVLHSRDRPEAPPLPAGLEGIVAGGRYFVCEVVGPDVHIAYPFHVEGALPPGGH